MVLQLRLWLLERLQHHVPNISSSFTEVEAHAFTAETLAYNVELDAILVDHVGNSVVIVVSSAYNAKPKKKEADLPIALINDLTPSIAIEVLTRQLTS